MPGPPPVRGHPAPRALYIHFPFCVHRCHYCDFSVKRSSDPPVGAWLEALGAELAWWRETAGWTPPPPRKLESVYLGGGTPSLLGAEGVDRLSEILSGMFALDSGSAEWTAEANPASFDRRLGEAWRRAGVNRLSLGVQALDHGVLSWLGRRHDVGRAREAVAAAAAAGFERINVDVMFGLPDEVERDLADEIEALVALGTGHVSLYGLSVEPRTPLASWIRGGRVGAPSEERYADEYRLLRERLIAAGFEHYEVSNFARPGHQSRHNWSYWKRIPYLGIGPSAHGFSPPVRMWNAFRWERYRRAIEGGAGPVEGWERLDGSRESLERIWLGLRTIEGLRREAVGEAGRTLLAGWESAGWVERRTDGWVATGEGWLRMDAMVTRLQDEEERCPSPH